MTIFERTVWILNQSFPDIYIELWFITIPLIAVLILAVYNFRKKNINIPIEFYLYLITTIILSGICAYIGAKFYDTQNVLGHHLNEAFFWTAAVLYIIEIIRHKNYRLLVIAIGGLLLLFIFWVSFTSNMSIANDWI